MTIWLGRPAHYSHVWPRPPASRRGPESGCFGPVGWRDNLTRGSGNSQRGCGVLSGIPAAAPWTCSNHHPTNLGVRAGQPWHGNSLSLLYRSPHSRQRVQPASIPSLTGFWTGCPPSNEVNLFRELVVRSAAEEVAREGVLDYVANSRHVFGAPASSSRLDLLVLASLSLTDGQDRVAQQASHEIKEALSDSRDHNIGPGWGGLLSEARQYIGGLRTEYNHELESLRMSHAGTVEEMRGEQERLNRRLEGLRSQIAEGREESRMDILQDILTEIAVSLQSFHQHDDGSDVPVRDIRASLARALRAGGAEEFGTVGETVPYDPRLHQASAPTSTDSPVRVCVPGTIVRGKLTGGRVLTQARVAQQSEGEQCK